MRPFLQSNGDVDGDRSVYDAKSISSESFHSTRVLIKSVLLVLQPLVILLLLVLFVPVFLNVDVDVDVTGSTESDINGAMQPTVTVTRCIRAKVSH